MERFSTWIVILFMALGMAGCGEEEEPIIGPSDEPSVRIIPGLSGDTYMNTKFGIRISNLPVDEWAVEDLGTDGQGLRVEAQQGIVPLYHLLLMEPVPSHQFVGLGNAGDINPVIDSGIPFIWISLNCREGGNYSTHDLSEELDWYIETRYFAEVESKEFVSIENVTGIQAVLLRSFGKEALTWFAKGEVCVRCEYIAQSIDFDKHFAMYEHVLGNILLMGR